MRLLSAGSTPIRRRGAARGGPRRSASSTPAAYFDPWAHSLLPTGLVICGSRAGGGSGGFAGGSGTGASPALAGPAIGATVAGGPWDASRFGRDPGHGRTSGPPNDRDSAAVSAEGRLYRQATTGPGGSDSDVIGAGRQSGPGFGQGYLPHSPEGSRGQGRASSELGPHAQAALPVAIGASSGPCGPSLGARTAGGARGRSSSRSPGLLAGRPGEPAGRATGRDGPIESPPRTLLATQGMRGQKLVVGGLPRVAGWAESPISLPRRPGGWDDGGMGGGDMLRLPDPRSPNCAAVREQERLGQRDQEWGPTAQVYGCAFLPAAKEDRFPLLAKGVRLCPRT